jgi:crotonobetainyl-CoA:carnitine CoA-transferase CaiB-like acyl-CoA transferase
VSPTQGGPLAGIRVVDLTINVLGPLATQVLGDMGADVVKVEPPAGDPMRQVGPARHAGMSAMFLNLNRNKRSVVLDLKNQQDAATLHRLLASADVFVHSMRPKAIERLGFGYEVAARQPRLIYAVAPGYNSAGPRRDRPAYDDVIQGESGIADMMAAANGAPGFFPTVMADKYCGMSLASAIGMALFARERSGAGQRVEVPMLESMLAFNLVEHLWGGVFGDEGRLGYPRPLSPHRRPYATQDGHLCVMVQTDEQWRAFFKLCGSSELGADPRFSTLGARTANIAELYALVAERMQSRTTAQWQQDLDAHDIPNAPVARLQEMPLDPYLAETGFLAPYDHPSEGRLLNVAIPHKFSSTPPSFRLPPPRLGEHSQEILQSLAKGPSL